MATKQSPTVSPERLKSRLEMLAAIGADACAPAQSGVPPTGIPPACGISRFPYTEAHAQAVRIVAGWMREAGLEAGVDGFGNLVGVRAGLAGWPAIILGSHIDTVPHGGMFDGALGVVAGVEVAQALREAGRDLRHAMAAVAFAVEEGSAFGIGALASRCLLGGISRDKVNLLRGRDGRTIAELIAAFDPGLPRTTIPAQAGAYLELHIEQGPVLALAGRRAAAVTGIAGIARTTMVLEGEANHAGTTPMNFRRDALVGAAEIVLAVRRLSEAAGHSAVGTVGVLTVPGGAATVVPGRVDLTIEIRAPEGNQLRRLRSRIEKAINRIASHRNLLHHVAPWDHRDPVPLAPEIQKAIAAAILQAGHEPHAMVSGAGHDAMTFAAFVPAGMIFVPSVGGISHSPREWTEWSDAALGAELLLQTTLLLDDRGPLETRSLPLAYLS